MATIKGFAVICGTCSFAASDHATAFSQKAIYCKHLVVLHFTLICCC